MSMLDVINGKIFTRDQLKKMIAAWRILNDKIVFTNGCFDILHRGHIDYLAKAKDLGNRLIIGLNSDASVKMLGKGENRPIQDEHSRAAILAALHMVDAIIIFSEETPEDLIKFLEPDVLVKGGDYKVEQIAGHRFILDRGGKVEIIPFLEGYSTTSVEKKIKGS